MFLVTQSPQIFDVDSPHFQALPADSALNRSEMSCLPESKSPVKHTEPVRTYHPAPIEHRLMQKSQAAKRKVEELRQRKEQSEAADVRDRPYVSQKSKELAAQAEQRFWNSHLSAKPSRPPSAYLSTLKERIRYVLSSPPKAAPAPRVCSAANTRRAAVQRPQYKLHSRKASSGGESTHSYRAITPVPMRVAFDSGCDFSRLEKASKGYVG